MQSKLTLTTRVYVLRSGQFIKLEKITDTSVYGRYWSSSGARWAKGVSEWRIDGSAFGPHPQWDIIAEADPVLAALYDLDIDELNTDEA